MPEPLTKAGRYQLVSEIGRGSMGVVYKGFDPVIGRTVAIKTMLTQGLTASEFEDFKARFQREAQAAGILTHPNIVTVYDFGEDNGVLYLAMEFLVGRSIQDLVEEQSVLPVETIIPMYEQVCSALDHAHAHDIIHRDVKPANIMVLESGLVKVTDFGIAKVMSMGMTQAGQILGTPNYMSPEQVRGRQIDGRSDIFSLGVILYELVTGEKPFGGQNITTVIYRIINEDPIPPRELDSTIHPGLSYIVQKALAKKPEDRYQTCRELAEDLKNYANLGGAVAPSATVVVRVPPLSPSLADTARRPAVDQVSLRPSAPPPPPSPVARSEPARARPLSVQVIPPATAQRKGSSPAVWVLLILLLVAAGGGGYYYFFVLHRPQPPPLVQTSPQPQAQQQTPAPTGPSPESASTPADSQAPTGGGTAPEAAVPKGETAQSGEPSAAPLAGPTAPAPEAAAKPAPQEAKPPERRESTAAAPPPSPPRPAAPKVGSLLVTSSIAGAKITVDGKSDPAWVTPFTIPNLTAGMHSVSVAKEGYNVVQRGVTIEGGQTANYSAELTVPMGEANVLTNPSGLEILIDGEPAGQSPVQKILPVGHHTFTVRAPGMEPYTSSFDIRYNGYMITKRVDLGGSVPAATGVVEVRTDPPGATLQADGKAVGGTTPTSIRLSSGRHILTLSLPGYQSLHKVVEVPADGTITVRETLSH